MEQVVRGHLWIESGLITLIEAVLPFPDRVDLARFTFVQKLDLATAHGFVRPEDVPAYRRLNAIRNKVAHRLDGALGEQDQADLVNTFGSELRAMFDQYIEDKGLTDAHWTDRFSYAVLYLYLRLDVEHDRYQEHQASMLEINRQLKTSAEKLRTYLDGNPRAREIFERFRHVSPNSEVAENETAETAVGPQQREELALDADKLS